MAFTNQGLSVKATVKELRRSPEVILNFHRLKEDYGGMKSSGRLPRVLSKEEKKTMIKSNKKTTLGKLSRDPLIQMPKSTLFKVVKSSQRMSYKKINPQPRVTKMHQQNILYLEKNRMSWRLECEKTNIFD